jgi:hypothetical protein
MANFGALTDIAKVLAGQAPAPEAVQDETRDLVRRLLARVPEGPEEPASAAARPPQLPAAPPAAPADAYDRAFAAVFERVDRQARDLARERTMAAVLWSELLGHDPERRRMRVRNDRRFHTWAFCDRLLDESRKAGRSEPRRALEIAELALEAAHHLDAGRYGAERLSDLLGMAWCAVGEARRLLGDRGAARAALDCAREVIARGTGDPLARATLAGHDASLAMDLQEYAEAAGHLDLAIRLHRRFGDVDFAGERVVQEALRRAKTRRGATANRDRRRSG